MIPAITAAFLAVTTYGTAKSLLAPIAGLAFLIDAAVVGIWYLAGTLLNNATVKASASGELYQLIATIVMVAIILGSMVAVGGMFFSIASGTELLAPANVLSLCNGLEANSVLTLLNSPSSSVLFGLSSSSGGLCPTVDSVTTTTQTTLTEQVDYPLAATGVVLANLTNQTATQLNQAFLVDAWLGFLEDVKPQLDFCLAAFEMVPVQCLAPLPEPPPDLIIHTSVVPYAGLKMIYKSFSSLGALMMLAYESFVAQLSMLEVFLYAWPYMLFAGIVLRATFFTRKIGGLLIAIVVGAMLFYPALFSIEYLVMGNGLASLTGFSPAGSPAYTYSANSIPSAYGYNSIFSDPMTFIPASASSDTPYLTNFYVLPNIQVIAEHDGCWPGTPKGQTGDGNLFNAELGVAGYFLSPVTTILTYYNNGASITSPPDPLSSDGLSCNEYNSLATLFDLLKVYGVDGVTAYFLPIINIMVVLAGIIGLSGLLGGDTQLAGLAKFI